MVSFRTASEDCTWLCHDCRLAGFYDYSDKALDGIASRWLPADPKVGIDFYNVTSHDMAAPKAAPESIKDRIGVQTEGQQAGFMRKTSLVSRSDQLAQRTESRRENNIRTWVPDGRLHGEYVSGNHFTVFHY